MPTSASELLNAASGKALQTPEEIAREHDHDLLPKLITYLDRHLIYPLVNFIGDDEDPESTRAKYELLKKTNMTDYVASLYCEMEGVEEPPKEFAVKRQQVLDRLDKFEQESEKITGLLGREDVVTGLRSDKVANLEFLKKEHGVCHSKASSNGQRKLRFCRSQSIWSTSSMTLATSNTAVAIIQPPPNSSINSASSPPTTTKSPPRRGAS